MSDAADALAVREYARDLTILLIPPALIILGIVLGFVRARKDEGEKFAFVPLFICFAIAVLGALSQLNGGAR